MNGYDYKDFEKKLAQLKTIERGVEREIHYAVIALAAKFVEILEYNSPYDTGLLEDSWVWDIEYAGKSIHLKIWNVARNKDGQYYAEWVNDGHRLKRKVKDADGVPYLKQIGYVDGQFFIELSEFEVRRLLPTWKVATERQLAKVIQSAMRG